MGFTSITTFLLLFVTFLAVVHQSETWWSRRSSSSSGSSSGSSGSSGGNSGSSGSSGSGGSLWQRSKDYVTGFKNGAGDMYKAYTDMREANWKDSDKYFHTRGNYDAAQHGTGGRHAAKIISDLREGYGWLKGDSAADRAADQEANEHGRNGGDPNKYRPEGLPDKYKR
ncbi:serum amyloid A-5 protein-like [Ruditapes philippinarum]|uniref:serum amyloid A-5 protein-like n=1 Tax=Ruditapes philippinarum TaxID=129788 RepID=UPI00295B4AFB|nr:serum amyloid A-5 protein-like [Ruditapes philippinarum]